jgi:hypothetical protein
VWKKEMSPDGAVWIEGDYLPNQRWAFEFALAMSNQLCKDLRKHLTPTLSYIGEGAKFPPDVGGIKGGRLGFCVNSI